MSSQVQPQDTSSVLADLIARVNRLETYPPVAMRMLSASQDALNTSGLSVQSGIAYSGSGVALPGGGITFTLTRAQQIFAVSTVSIEVTGSQLSYLTMWLRIRRQDSAAFSITGSSGTAVYNSASVTAFDGAQNKMGIYASDLTNDTKYSMNWLAIQLNDAAAYRLDIFYSQAFGSTETMDTNAGAPNITAYLLG